MKYLGGTRSGAGSSGSPRLPAPPGPGDPGRHALHQHHHFKVLRQAGILRQRYEGTVKINSLRREDLERVLPGLLGAVIGAADRGAPQTTGPR